MRDQGAIKKFMERLKEGQKEDDARELQALLAMTSGEFVTHIRKFVDDANGIPRGGYKNQRFLYGVDVFVALGSIASSVTQSWDAYKNIAENCSIVDPRSFNVSDAEAVLAHILIAHLHRAVDDRRLVDESELEALNYVPPADEAEGGIQFRYRCRHNAQARLEKWTTFDGTDPDQHACNCEICIKWQLCSGPVLIRKFGDGPERNMPECITCIRNTSKGYGNPCAGCTFVKRYYRDKENEK